MRCKTLLFVALLVPMLPGCGNSNAPSGRWAGAFKGRQRDAAPLPTADASAQNEYLRYFGDAR